MTRASFVRDPFIRAVIKAECVRARRVGGLVDRFFLRDETGLSGYRLESRISQANRELDSAADHRPATEGGANGADDVSPTNGPNPDPFAPSASTTGKGKP